MFREAAYLVETQRSKGLRLADSAFNLLGLAYSLRSRQERLSRCRDGWSNLKIVSNQFELIAATIQKTVDRIAHV